MRPLKLTMQAFLSYKGRETIDFSAFEGSLFLIDGETGAGKTSIFDAIMYALYGVSSGGLRTVEELRSHYASKEDETFVSLSFRVHGKEYLIERKPQQMVPGKRKKDLVRQNSSVVLSGEGLPSALTKSAEVERKIKELIGLDESQFLMTTMIPQGKFMELVAADTKARQSLLRDILGTSFLVRFAENLRLKAKELSEKVKATEERIDILCGQYETDDPEHLRAIRGEEGPGGSIRPHDKLKEVGPMLSRDVADRQIKRDELLKAKAAAEAAAKRARADLGSHRLEEAQRMAYDENKAKLDALLPSEATMKARKEANERYDKAGLVLFSYGQEAKARKDLEAAERSLKESKAKVEETEKRLQIALEKSKKTVDLAAENDRLVAEEEKTVAVISKLASLPAKEEEAARAASCLHEASERLSSREGEIGQLRKKAQALREQNADSKVASLLASSEKELEGIAAREKQLLSLRSAYCQYREALRAEESAKVSYEKARAAYLSADEEYRAAFLAYLDGQAGLLASRLEEGKPCPVCGSSSHPQPALASSGIDEAALKAAEERKENGRIALGEASSEAKALAARREDLGTALLSKAKEELGGAPELASLESTFNEEEALLLQKKGAAEKALALHREMAAKEERELKAAAAAEKEAVRLEESLPALRLALSKAQEGKASAESLLSSLREETSGLDLKELEQRKAKIAERRKEIESETSALRKELSLAERGKAALAAEIGQGEANFKKAIADLEAAEQAYRQSLTDNGFVDVEEAKALHTRSAAEVTASKEDVDAFYAALNAARSLEEDQRKKGYHQLPVHDLAAEEETCKDLEHDALTKSDAALAFKAKLEQAVRLKDEIKELIDRSSEDIRKASEALALSEAARGTMAGTLRIDFETFYQSQIFSGIVDRASLRFSAMSGGAFRLVAHNFWEEAGKALDIDVVDENTGRVRPVSTLSGGEAFQAALALALSLSDVIASEAGGSEIDCLFIDEGFGNLDARNLDSVVRTIREIAEGGHRTVGIISHVESLASAIERKIEVKKGPGGSRLKVVA